MDRRLSGGLLIKGWELGSLALYPCRAILAFTRLPRRETILPNFYQIGVLEPAGGGA